PRQRDHCGTRSPREGGRRWQPGHRWKQGYWVVQGHWGSEASGGSKATGRGARPLWERPWPRCFPGGPIAAMAAPTPGCLLRQGRYRGLGGAVPAYALSCAARTRIPMFTNLPPVTKALLIANGLVFLLQLVVGTPALSMLMLWPLQAGGDLYAQGIGFMPWQLLTYGFLHDPTNFAHLLFNMLALLMFGAPLEYTWGNRRFLTYYLVCVGGAGLCQLVVTPWLASQGAPVGPTLGA